MMIAERLRRKALGFSDPAPVQIEEEKSSAVQEQKEA
jgi:hypothetical protein